MLPRAEFRSAGTVPADGLLTDRAIRTPGVELLTAASVGTDPAIPRRFSRLAREIAYVR